MLTATLILMAMAAVLSIAAFSRSRQTFLAGLVSARKTFLQQLPLLLAAFAVAGYLEILIPHHLVKQWLGFEAGFQGVLLGSLIGIFMAAGPYVIFPIIIALYGAGASNATVIAMTTSYMLMGFSKLPYEVALLGIHFTLRRVLLSMAFPVLAGLLVLLFNV